MSRILDEQRIAGWLERVLAVRLRAERAPDARHRRLRQARIARHGARAPVGGTRWHALQRLGDHRVDECVVDAARRSGPWGIKQAIEPLLDKAASPLRYHLMRDSLACRDHLVVRARCASQDDARSQRQGLRRLAPKRQRFELLSFRLAQHQLSLRSSVHQDLAVCTRYTTDSDEN